MARGNRPKETEPVQAVFGKQYERYAAAWAHLVAGQASATPQQEISAPPAEQTAVPQAPEEKPAAKETKQKARGGRKTEKPLEEPAQEPEPQAAQPAPTGAPEAEVKLEAPAPKEEIKTEATGGREEEKAKPEPARERGEAAAEEKTQQPAAGEETPAQRSQQAGAREAPQQLRKKLDEALDELVRTGDALPDPQPPILPSGAVPATPSGAPMPQRPQPQQQKGEPPSGERQAAEIPKQQEEIPKQPPPTDTSRQTQPQQRAPSPAASGQTPVIQPPAQGQQPTPRRAGIEDLTPEMSAELFRKIHATILGRGGKTVQVEGELQQLVGQPITITFRVQQGWTDAIPFSQVLGGIRSQLGQIGWQFTEKAPGVRMKMQQGRFLLEGEQIFEEEKKRLVLRVLFEPLAQIAPTPQAGAPTGQQQVVGAPMTDEEQRALDIARAVGQLYSTLTGPKVPPTLYRSPQSTIEYYTPYMMSPQMVPGFLDALRRQIPFATHDEVLSEPVSVRPSGKPLAPGEQAENVLPGIRYVFVRTSPLTGDIEPVASFVAPIGQPRVKGLFGLLGLAASAFLHGLLGMKPGTFGFAGVTRLHPTAQKELAGQTPVQKAYERKPIQTMHELLTESTGQRGATEYNEVVQSVVRELPRLRLIPTPGNPALWGEEARQRWMEASGGLRMAVPIAYLSKSRELEGKSVGVLRQEGLVRIGEILYTNILKEYGVEHEGVRDWIAKGLSSLPTYAALFESGGAFAGGAPTRDLAEKQDKRLIGAMLGPVWRDAGGLVHVSETDLHPNVLVETGYTQGSDLTASIMMALTSPSNNVTANRAQAAIMTNLLAALHKSEGGITHRAYSELPFKIGEAALKHRLALRSPGPRRGELASTELQTAGQYLERGRSWLTKAMALSGMELSKALVEEISKGGGTNPLYSALQEALASKSPDADVMEGLATLWVREWEQLPDKVGLLLSGASSGFVTFGTDPKQAVGGGLVWPMMYGRMWGISNLPAVATRMAIAQFGEIGRGHRAKDWLVRGLVADAVSHVAQKVTEEELQGIAQEVLGEEGAKKVSMSDVLFYTTLLATHPNLIRAIPSNKSGDGWASVSQIVDSVLKRGLHKMGITVGEGTHALMIAQDWRKDLEQTVDVWLSSASKVALSLAGGQLLQYAVGQSALDVVASSWLEVRDVMGEIQQNRPAGDTKPPQERVWWWEYEPREIMEMADYVQSKVEVEDWPDKITSVLRPFEQPSSREQTIRAFLGGQLKLDLSEVQQSSQRAYRVLSSPMGQSVLGVTVGERSATGIGTHFLWRALPFGRTYQAEVDFGPLTLAAKVGYLPTQEDPAAYGVGFKVYEYLKTMITPPKRRVVLGEGFPIDAHMQFALFNNAERVEETHVSVSFENLPIRLELEPKGEAASELGGWVDPAVQEYSSGEQSRREQIQLKLKAYEVVAGLRALQAGVPLVRIPEDFAENVAGWAKEQQKQFYDSALDVASRLAVWEAVAGQGVLEPDQEERLVQDIARGFAELQIPHAINQAFQHQYFVVTQAKRQETGSYEQLAEAAGVRRSGSTPLVPFLSTFRSE